MAAGFVAWPFMTTEVIVGGGDGLMGAESGLVSEFDGADEGRRT